MLHAASSVQPRLTVGAPLAARSQQLNSLRDHHKATVGVPLEGRTTRQRGNRPIGRSAIPGITRVIGAPARPASSPKLGFVPQEELFASLTLSAALRYVRYFATLRSYSDIVDIMGRGFVSRLRLKMKTSFMQRAASCV